jgi:hypothetical protein
VLDSGAHPCGSSMEGSVTRKGRTVVVSLSSAPIVYDAMASKDKGCPAMIGSDMTKLIYIPPGNYRLILRAPTWEQCYQLSIMAHTYKTVLVGMPSKAPARAS